LFKLSNSFLLLALLSLSLQSCASTLEPSQQGKTLAQYHSLYKEHAKNICPNGTEDEFNKLLKRYRGQGHWVPELASDVDFVTVEKLIPEIEKKLKWIQEQRKWLIQKKKLPGLVTLENIEKKMKTLLQHKRVWETDTNEKNRKNAGENSLAELKKLRGEWAKLVRLAPFLTNYSFPVDHLKNRKIYDEFRDQPEPTSQQIANYAFFYRRLLEDGAYNPDQTSSDSWLRTTIDTVQLEMDRPMLVLEEDLRYDLQFVLARMKKEIQRGKPALVARLGEWEERTSRALQFYQDLVRPENKEKARAHIREKNQATLLLKEWVASKQTLSWLWWKKQDDTMKALYSIETILYNEVGDVDTQEALERLDVAQVVVNRHGVPFYRELDQAQEMFPLLRKELSEKAIQNEYWLNVLYRRGEFSFTYYYMPGAVKAFCPDFSKTGLRLQRENLEIALALLRNPRNEFKALRYFSRASMPGRINMASVWENYHSLPERPGLLAESQDKLRTLWSKGAGQYLYQFQDPTGERYQVVEIENKIYVARLFQEKWLFYSWRNPHYFTYFGLNGNSTSLK
jgi:hypothetical protein